MSALTLLAITPLGVLAFFSILRFVFQLHGADFYNKIVQFVRLCTDFYCRPLRSFLPRIGRADSASLASAYFLEVIAFFLLFNMQAAGVLPLPQILIWGVLAILGLLLRIYFIALILTVIFSWVRPQGSNALAEISEQIIAPLLKPVRRLLPPFGGLDFTPILLFFLIYFLRSIWRNVAVLSGMPMLVIFGV